MLSPRDNNPVFGVLLLGDKTSSIGVLSIVWDKVSINGVLSPGDYNQVFEVLLLGDKPHLWAWSEKPAMTSKFSLLCYHEMTYHMDK